MHFDEGKPSRSHGERPPLSPHQAQRKHRQAKVERLEKRGLRVGRTSVGKGVFATKRIVDGTCIGQIEGRVISEQDYVSRYAFDLGDGTQLEPTAPFRFVNHSCSPNCAFEAFSFPGPTSPTIAEDATLPSPAVELSTHPAAAAPKILLYSICDIRLGEELTIDYSWPARFAIPCNCHSAHCRGWIVDSKHLAELQQLLQVRAIPDLGII
ncbi:SET domain-containing protein [Aureliella helgolandensis]|uniref:SET domain protein n=1 Tax=Aureliella helgolandensis TaxID=2527968 RepID=A0A518G2N5_9BACT|nr:SET domain-containing protein [Aureliella helgolandensis]QDV22815.1 SET domain protein [Aureliella helgolandensis]